MKRNRNLIMFCIAMIISSFTILTISGQTTDNINKTGKETVKSGETVKEEPIDKGISDATQQSVKQVENEQVAIKNRADERYRIGFQDTLDVQVYRRPELSQTVSVNPDGTIRLFRIDNPVVAVCKTERELAYTIETLYKNHLRTPRVNVRAVEQRSQPFAVMGAVQKPGSFFLNQRVRLIQLLSFAGGFDVEKAGRRIQIARMGNFSGCEAAAEQLDKDQEVEFLSYDLADVLKGEQNPWMEPGDIVSVLIADEAYVVGNVMEPTNVKLQGPTTLTQAIAMAKGLSKNAKTDRVIIERQERGNTAKTDLVFNLKDIRDGKVPDPQLQANDIVVVSTDKTKAITGSVVKIITGGLPGLFWGL